MQNKYIKLGYFPAANSLISDSLLFIVIKIRTEIRFFGFLS